MGNAPQLDVEVRTSTRRRKTAAARIEGGRVVVVVPAHWAAATRERVVADLVGRLARRHPSVASSDDDLMRRAETLAEKYFGGVRPSSVRWVANQSTRWASCTTLDGRIRVSDRLRGVPPWVLDAVLVHELAHLVEQDHSPRFHELENRYPKRADAEHYLAGFAHGLAWRGAADAGERGARVG
jgi:predicted metal-dependent hydrolase